MSYTRDEIIGRMFDLFFSRSDVYARSHAKPDGTFGYSPSCACGLTCMLGTKCPRWRPQEVTGEIIYKHMMSTSNEPYPLTIGSYSTSPNQEARWIVFDVDAHGAISRNGNVDRPGQASISAHQTVAALCGTLKGLHIPHYVEESGMGWHIWVFTPPIAAEIAHKAGRQVVDMTEDCATDVEVFPKQSKIAEGGFGNLVKVPYGLHWSGRKCLFIDMGNEKKYIQAQWEYLLEMQKVEPLQLERLAAARHAPGPLRRVESIRQVNATLPPDGRLPGPPCVTAMWNARLSEGEGRNQVLHQLAVDLQRGGFLNVDNAKEILYSWNQNQVDPLDEREFNSAIEHAYSGARYSYGTDRPIVGKYCENNAGCPICDNPDAKIWSIVNSSRGMKI